MANAFYSLYSHVSRTPLQKLAPPEFTFYSSPVERMERFRSSIRSEPRSPVERLKDTVSKMCLYTGSPRGSESTSPQPSPKKRCSLSDVGELDQETLHPRVAKNLHLGESTRNNSTADVRLAVVDPESCHSGTEVRGQETSASDTLHSRPNCCSTNNKNTDGNSNKAVSIDNKTQGARTSLSLETVDRGDNQCPLCQQALNPTGTPAATAAPEEPLSCCRPKPNTASCICSARHVDASSFPSFMQKFVSELDQNNPTQPCPAQICRSNFARCCIIPTGREGEDMTSCSRNTAGSHHASAVPAKKTCEGSLHQRDIRYLTPPARQNQGSVSSNLQKVNSFELEEVCYSFKRMCVLCIL